MELRHLFYFKTVAEELHFRKAAEKLFLSQPPLSRQIKELEEELGVILFERNNKRVALTPAGEYFKKEIDQLFKKLEDTKNRIKEIHGAVSGVLRIAYISSVNYDDVVETLKKLNLIYPHVKTKLYELPTIKQVRSLEEGKLDIGIMRSPVASEHLQVQSLFSESFSLVVPSDYPSFDNLQELSLYIQDKPFIFFNRDYAPEYYRKLLEICQRLGFSPEISHEANNVHSILNLVEKGLGVSIVPQSLKHKNSHLDVSYINLQSIPIQTEVVLAFRDEQLHAGVKCFIEEFLLQINK